jgi:hypothetical protein
MQIWLATAVADHPGVSPPIPRLCAASPLHHPLQSIRPCQPALDRRRQNEARDILILTFHLIEARRYEYTGCANRIHCR